MDVCFLRGDTAGSVPISSIRLVFRHQAGKLYAFYSDLLNFCVKQGWQAMGWPPVAQFVSGEK